MTTVQTAPDVLTRARALVVPALEDTVARLNDELRLPVEYHLGWRAADGAPVPGRSGKFVRPALAVLSTEAAGAPAGVGVPGAVAVELLHNFSLVHDDVIDRDAERRHRPTVWAQFGVATAVIAGDALLALAHQTLLDQPGAGARVAARSLACATTALIGGEADDMAFEQRLDVSVDECLEMAVGKTGALLACASSIGVLLAEGGVELYEALADYGLNVGLAFQAVDDVLGIWGDPAATGKPAWSDLRDRKKTLPIAVALASGHGGVDELRALLGGDLLGDDEVARAAVLVEACGGRDETERQARSFLGAALEAIDDVNIPEPTRAELTDLARFVVDRDF